MRRGVVAMLALVVLAGCRDSSAGQARTTVPTRPSTSSTSTTAEAVSYEIPAVIDAAYVERVMAALDHVEGEAARRVATQQRLDEEFLKYLASIYSPRAFSLTQEAWLALAGTEFKDLASTPGDPRTRVLKIISATPSCIVIAADRDFSAMFVTPDPPAPQRYIALTPVAQDRNPSGYNKTPWIISFDGNFKDEREPAAEEACVS